jgi:hypothetical protein
LWQRQEIQEMLWIPLAAKKNQSVDGRLVRILVQSSFNPVTELI